MSTPAPDSIDVDGDAEADRPSPALSPEDRHRILANDRRRRTLAVLDGLTAPVSVEELAAAVTSETVESASENRVTISLHHHHLPLLDEADVLDYDPETNRVTTLRTTLSAER